MCPSASDPVLGIEPGDVWFDTDDRRLAQWGAAVRRRSGTGWLVAVARPDKSGPTEVDTVAVADHEGDEPPEAVVALVRPLTGGVALRLVDHADVRTPAEPTLLPPDVVADRSARTAVRRAIAASVRHLLVHLPAARLGVDPEGVHQARVATRRLRSDLRTFRSLLDDDWVRSLRADLSGLADALGAVRDDDVLLGRLRSGGAALDDVDDTDVDAIAAILVRERDAHRAALLELLDDERTMALFARLIDAANDPPTTERAFGRAERRMVPLVARPLRKLERAVDRLGDDPPMVELHQLRLLVKRVRYAAEAVAPTLGRPAARFAKAAAGLQEVLGELNDAEVTAAWLARVAPDLESPAAFAAGRLAQRGLEHAEAHRRDWRGAHRRLVRRIPDEWLR